MDDEKSTDIPAAGPSFPVGSSGLNPAGGASRIWMTLALDPCERQLIIAGFAPSEDACAEHAGRVDAAYAKSFAVSADNLGDQVADWLMTCGVLAGEAGQLMRDHVEQMKQVLKTEP